MNQFQSFCEYILTSLDPLTEEQKDSYLNFSDVDNILGTERLGSGYFSAVYEHPYKTDLVVKVCRKIHDASFGFMAYCMHTRGEYLPEYLEAYASLKSDSYITIMPKYTSGGHDRADNYEAYQALKSVFCKGRIDKESLQQKLMNIDERLRPKISPVLVAALLLNGRGDVRDENCMINPITNNIIFNDVICESTSDFDSIKEYPDFINTLIRKNIKFV